jgi:hypothetical protein
MRTPLLVWVHPSMRGFHLHEPHISFPNGDDVLHVRASCHHSLLHSKIALKPSLSCIQSDTEIFNPHSNRRSNRVSKMSELGEYPKYGGSDAKILRARANAGFQRNHWLKPNFLGIVGGLLAIVSIALPWWAMAVTFSFMGIGREAYVSVFLYQAKTTFPGFNSNFQIHSLLDLWFGWIALALVVFGSLFGTVGGLFGHRKAILVGGAIALASLAVFAIGLQSAIWRGTTNPWGIAVAGIFSTGTIYEGSLKYDSYTTYLSFGFWITLAATITMLIASRANVVNLSPPQSSPDPPRSVSIRSRMEKPKSSETQNTPRFNRTCGGFIQKHLGVRGRIRTLRPSGDVSRNTV